MKSTRNMIANLLITSVLLIMLSSINIYAQQIVEENVNGHVKLWIEAEAGQIDAPMKIFERNDASGGQFVEVISGNNNMESAPDDGYLTYKFDIETAGIYKVWGRVMINMDEEDAFWVKMDDQDWVKWKDISVGCDWHWDEIHDNNDNDKVMEYKLDKGSHTLTFTYLLDQTRLDKLLITNDLDLIPTESGPGAKALFTASSHVPAINQEVTFDASTSISSEGKIVTHDWDFGDGNKANGKSVTHAFKNTGDYKVKLIVIDDTGLNSIATKKVTAYTGDPVASFIYFPDRSKADEVVTFDASSSFDPDGEVVKYSWEFGDGAKGNGIKVKHAYASPGEYDVILDITDSQGKTEKLTRMVTVITGIPKKIIFETDMCLDVDDVGALAVLHAMANNSEVELLAVCFNEVHPFGASAIDAINTWYGRGDIPVGVYKDALAKPDYSPYLEPVSKFPNDLDSENAPSALEVYQKVLSEQPDNSVTIVSVGFLNNLSDLLRNSPDLVAQKVKELVVMGGVNNDGFNLSRHNLVSESQNVIANWPTPLVISQPGGSVLTGPGLIDTPVENPVREGYYKFFHDNFCKRPSWDQIAVLYGVRGLSDYFSRNTTGTGTLRNGYKWKMKEGHRSFIEALFPVDTYAKIIQDLMIEPPLIHRKTQAKKVIYETNMGQDVDDVGGLAMIHALQNRGEAELLAVCFNEVHPDGAAAIDAINTWYGRGDVPVGIYKGSLPDPDTSAYLNDLTRFPHDVDKNSASSALEVYQDVLAKQPDNSVTIISVGFLINLHDLIKNEPALVAKKVKELVIMGVAHSDGHNLIAHNTVNASQYVLENWPSPIVFHHLGGDIMTGAGLEKTPEENPVREAYYKYFNSNFKNRPSWDPITVLYGVRGNSYYFTKNDTGEGLLPNGFKWDLQSHNHSSLEARIPADLFARIMEELIVEAPEK